MLKVKVFVINANSSTFYGLKTADDNQELPYTPYWKTKRDAIRWAEEHNLEVVRDSDRRDRQ